MYATPNSEAIKPSNSAFLEVRKEMGGKFQYSTGIRSRNALSMPIVTRFLVILHLFFG